MAITKERARQDIETIMQHFGTAGRGTEQERAVQLVLQSLEVLEGRLSNSKTIKLVYINNPEVAGLLPPAAYEVARRYANGKLDEQAAGVQLRQLVAQYKETFKEMGIALKEK